MSCQVSHSRSDRLKGKGRVRGKEGKVDGKRRKRVEKEKKKRRKREEKEKKKYHISYIIHPIFNM